MAFSFLSLFFFIQNSDALSRSAFLVLFACFQSNDAGWISYPGLCCKAKDPPHNPWAGVFAFRGEKWVQKFPVMESWEMKCDKINFKKCDKICGLLVSLRCQINQTAKTILTPLSGLYQSQANENHREHKLPPELEATSVRGWAAVSYIFIRKSPL